MGTTLASVMTTPIDPNKKRHDVEIEMVKLANYQINLRSFHPNIQFEAKGFFFHGDNRGFSLGKSFYNPSLKYQIPLDSVTSRVWSIANIDLSKIIKSQASSPIKVESNTSGPLRVAGVPIGIIGHDENYSDKQYKPSGEIQVVVPDVKFESPRSFNFKTKYVGENHAFIFSHTAKNITEKTFVPSLDVYHEFMIRVERINKYMDITTLVYGDGFPNAEGFIEDSQGNKVLLGAHIRIGSPATHLFGDNKRLMWANAIRIGLTEDGTFTNTLWIFAQGLGGPKMLRDLYGLQLIERKAKTTRSIYEPLSTSGAFFWDFQEVNTITKKNYKAPFRLKISSDLPSIENHLFESFNTPPILKTTVQAWNNLFLNQNPNEGRDKAIYQLDDSRWKK